MDEFDRRVTEKMERDKFTFEEAAKAVFLEEKKEKDEERKKKEKIEERKKKEKDEEMMKQKASEWVKKLSYRSCRTEFNRLEHLYSM